VPFGPAAHASVAGAAALAASPRGRRLLTRLAG
jgi:hypothetical protein